MADSSDPPPSAYSSFLISSWLNLCLYTLEFILVVCYWKSGRPSRQYKIVIFVSLINDTLCTIAVCANAYMHVVDAQSLPFHPLWTVPVSILTTYVSSLLEQTVFTSRYWSLTDNGIVTFIIGLFIVAHMVFGIVAAAFVAAQKDFAFNFGVPASIAAASLCASTDLLIAISLTWELYRIRAVHESTKALIRNVCIRAVTCGVVTSGMTATMIILLFVDFTAFTFFFACLGRIYTLSVLVNFILLKRIGADQSRSNATGDTDAAGTTPGLFSTIHFRHDHQSTRRESTMFNAGATDGRRPPPRKLSLQGATLDVPPLYRQPSNNSMRGLRKDLPLLP